MSLPIVQSYTYITDDILHVFMTTLTEQLADSYFNLLASISRGRVVRDVHDLQLLLGLGIIDWSHCVLACGGEDLQELKNKIFQ